MFVQGSYIFEYVAQHSADSFHLYGPACSLAVGGATRQGCPMSAADFTSRYVTTIRGLIPLCYIARRFILKCQYHGKKRREHLAQGPLDQ